MGDMDHINPLNYDVADLVGLGPIEHGPREHMNTGSLEPYIVVHWKKQWYKIPFFVIDDIEDEWYDEERPPEQVLALSYWVCKHQQFTPWNKEDIRSLKKILDSEMPALSAYIIEEDKI